MVSYYHIVYSTLVVDTSLYHSVLQYRYLLISYYRYHTNCIRCYRYCLLYYSLTGWYWVQTQGCGTKGVQARNYQQWNNWQPRHPKHMEWKQYNVNSRKCIHRLLSSLTHYTAAYTYGQGRCSSYRPVRVQRGDTMQPPATMMNVILVHSHLSAVNSCITFTSRPHHRSSIIYKYFIDSIVLYIIVTHVDISSLW